MANNEASDNDKAFVEAIRAAYEKENPGEAIDDQGLLKYFKKEVFKKWQLTQLEANLKQIETTLTDDEETPIDERLTSAIALEFESAEELVEELRNGKRLPTLSEIADEMISDIRSSHPSMTDDEARTEAIALMNLVLGLTPTETSGPASSEGKTSVIELHMPVDRRTLRDIHTREPRVRRTRAKESEERPDARIRAFLERNHLDITEYTQAAFRKLYQSGDKGRELLQRFLRDTNGIHFTLAALNRDGILKYDIKDEDNRVISLSYETYLLLKFLSDLQEIPNFSRKIQRAGINPRALLIFTHNIIDETVAVERRIIDESK